MLDLHDQLRAYGSLVDEAVAPVGIVETARRATEPHLPAPRRLHPVLVAAAAAAIVLLVIGGFALLLGGTDRPVITTLPAPSTTAPATTEPATSTTATEAAAVPLPIITWTRVDDPVFDGPTNQRDISVRHIGSAVYVVGNDLENGTGVIWRSEDGYTWERFDDLDVFGGPPGVHEIVDIAGNDSVIVALGYEGNEAWLDLADPIHPPYTGSEAWCRSVVWVSEDDGHTWSRLTHDDAFGAGDGCGLRTITSWSDGFIAAGNGIWTSPDGLHWTKVAVLSGSEVILDLAITPSGIVGVGRSANDADQAAAYWSTDGTDWTLVTDLDAWLSDPGHTTSPLYGVVATDYGLVAVGTMGWSDEVGHYEAAVWLSPNGHTWRRLSDPELDGNHQEVMYDVTAVGDLLIGVGESTRSPFWTPQHQPYARSTGVVWISEDAGTTWHWTDDPDGVFGSYIADWISIRSVVSVGNQLVAAGYDGTGVAVWVGTIEKGEGR
jgi:hypothetical protein